MKKIISFIFASFCIGSPALAMESNPFQAEIKTITNTREQSAVNVIAALQNAPIRNAFIAAITGATFTYLEKTNPVVTMLYLLHQLQQLQ